MQRHTYEPPDLQYIVHSSRSTQNPCVRQNGHPCFFLGFKQASVVPVAIEREPREIRKLAHLFRQHAEIIVVEIHEDHVRE